MSMLAAMMAGGQLPPLGDLISLPCAVCVHLGYLDPARPVADAATLAGGSAVCRPHISAALYRHELHEAEEYAARVSTLRAAAAAPPAPPAAAGEV